MYKQIRPDIIQRMTDGAFIPTDPGNADYQAVLAWVAQGNTVDPIVPYTPPVPNSVTMRQARLALLQFGYLDLVDQSIDQIPDPIIRTAAKIDWEYAQTVDRDSAVTQQLAMMLGLSNEQLDSLFTVASTL